MFSFIKNKLGKIYNQFTSKAAQLFSRSTIDEHALQELEVLLISADTGVKTTRAILENLRQKHAKGQITKGEEVREALQEQLLAMLAAKESSQESDVYLLVGVNGSGKTTFAGKLAHKIIQERKKVLLVAADTFRAAATEQLVSWAEKSGADIVTGKQGQDPASVVYAGCEKYVDENYDALIIDTAGRLQTKVNLMKELEKIKRIIEKKLPEKKITTLLTIDAMLGQNSFEQARLFHESTHIDGIVLTKLDGTGKGGIVFAINQELGIPVAFISFGESIDQLKLFNAQHYISDLLTA